MDETPKPEGEPKPGEEKPAPEEKPAEAKPEISKKKLDAIQKILEIGEPEGISVIEEPGEEKPEEKPEENKPEAKPEEDKSKQIKNLLFIIGGVVLVLLIVFTVMKLRPEPTTEAAAIDKIDTMPAVAQKNYSEDMKENQIEERETKETDEPVVRNESILDVPAENFTSTVKSRFKNAVSNLFSHIKIPEFVKISDE